jgi:hypothetical protein
MIDTTELREAYREEAKRLAEIELAIELWKKERLG